MNNLKKCSGCKEIKDRSLFFKASKEPDGLQYCCKDCQKKRIKKIHKSVLRGYALKYTYGIDQEYYTNLLEKQEGKCAICNTNDPHGAWGVHFNVDHDHKTGKVRGLLCSSCNLGLGKFNDSINVLESAINYLRANENT